MIKPACCLLLSAMPLVVTLPHDTWLLFLDGSGHGASLSLRTGMDFPTSAHCQGESHDVAARAHGAPEGRGP